LNCARKDKAGPTALHQKRIGDYGIIGNLQTAALVGNCGSIDWLCLPDFDSPSAFAALLDEHAGYFCVRPASGGSGSASYLARTKILITRFQNAQGALQITDFMPVAEYGQQKSQPDVSHLYRRVSVTWGEMDIEVRFAPRFDYGRIGTNWHWNGAELVAAGGDQRLFLACSRGGMELGNDEAHALWRLFRGEELWLRLSWGKRRPEVFTTAEAQNALQATADFWHGWLSEKKPIADVDLGPYRDIVERSALLLKLLQYHPSGAMVAAPTTSLPEAIGGVRNWDYRFSWVRDSALTLNALFTLGHVAETDRYLQWLKGVLCSCLECQCAQCESASHLQVLYGLRGEKELPEQELRHLSGFKGSRPVRIGNGAMAQKQLDIYGEAMQAALKLAEFRGGVDAQLWPVLRSVGNYVSAHWREKDHGIWEVRNGPHHFVHSKVMCWVALDRALVLAQRFDLPGETGKWQEAREQIRQNVLERGWSEKKQAFVQHYDTEALDAACLLLPVFGFLPFDDSRIVSTTAAIRRELDRDGFLCRYLGPDGLSGREGVFLPCTFWLVDNLIGQGRLNEAEELLQQTIRSASSLGLLAEEYDPHTGEALGNYPQALSHIGLINSAVSLCRARAREGRFPGA
jgi:GH15 family glucan-1,4-alpha-glucosidase